VAETCRRRQYNKQDTRQLCSDVPHPLPNYVYVLFSQQLFPSSGSPNKILCVFLVSPKLAAVSFALLPPATVLMNSEGKSNKGRSFVCSAWNAVCTHTPLSNFASRPSFVFSLPAGVHPTPAMSELTFWKAKRLRCKVVYVSKHLAKEV